MVEYLKYFLEGSIDVPLRLRLVALKKPVYTKTVFKSVEFLRNDIFDDFGWGRGFLILLSWEDSYTFWQPVFSKQSHVNA